MVAEINGRKAVTHGLAAKFALSIPQILAASWARRYARRARVNLFHPLDNSFRRIILISWLSSE
jgi:hypothetical protein